MEKQDWKEVWDQANKLLHIVNFKLDRELVQRNYELWVEIHNAVLKIRDTCEEKLKGEQTLKDVVLCKDCARRPILSEPGSTSVFDLRESPDGWCPCLCEDPYYSRMPEDDWFCAAGERKEKETKDE